MEPEKIRRLRTLLISWGKENFRHYPWRETKDPYKILIAEILLHRTRADQVVPLYLNFIKRFPTNRTLTEADPDEIKQLLASAGLFWRIEMMHNMAGIIEDKFQGKIPHEKEILVSLPGVGNYIASALRCFAWGYPEILVDTNTVRITGRICGIEIHDGSRRQKKFLVKMEEILDKDTPEDFNYALLDLGSAVCLPRDPLCEKCPINSICQSAMV